MKLKNGNWGLGFGDWVLGIGPNPQSPIPNPQLLTFFKYIIQLNFLKINRKKIMVKIIIKINN